MEADQGNAAAERDLRLDFFRGLALLFIFLNHIPGNAVNWITTRNYGFSDATEIFVFISGYSAMLAFGGMADRAGWAVAAARIGRRVWQIYIAHILLFMVFVAHIAYVADRLNPIFAEEMGIAAFFDEPHILMLQALILKFKPANMDVLPMYIALLLAFPLLLWLLKRWPLATLAASFVLWLCVQFWRWNLPAHPDGGWFFNPLAWQFLFLIGAWCALQGNTAFWRRLPTGPTTALCIAYLLASLLIVCTWLYPPWAQYVPHWLRQLLYPINKTDLDLLRLLHFLAQAYLLVRLVPRNAGFLRQTWSRPFVLCGQNSLEVFCVGIFLSFAAQVVLVEISPGLPAQIMVSLAGAIIMVALARLKSWYTWTEKAGRLPPETTGRRGLK